MPFSCSNSALVQRVSSLFILCTVKDKNKNPLKFKRKFLYVCFKNSELDNGLKSRRERWDGLELFSQRKCVTGFSVTVWLTKGFKDVLGTEPDKLRNNTYYKISKVLFSPPFRYENLIKKITKGCLSCKLPSILLML